MTQLSDFLPDVPAPEPLQIRFILEEHGWASLDVECGDRSLTIGSFGYCTDALPDLIRTALLVVTGAWAAEVVFDGEPQQWGLTVENAGILGERTRIVRFWVADDGGRPLMENGRPIPAREWPSVVFQGHVTADDFGSAVVRAAEATLADFGEEGYRERWGYHGSLEGFPLRALNALKAALATPEVRT